ncbi:MAG: RsmD family RNA methyltransferase [Candidatus Omnitrophota bacterium]
MSLAIRPTENKVRQALFNILGDIHELSFLDLFAGTGSVGIDAARHGAGRVVFVENSRAALALLEKNVAKVCPKDSDYLVLPLDVYSALDKFVRRGERFDIVFLDPPYLVRSSEFGVGSSKPKVRSSEFGVGRGTCPVRASSPSWATVGSNGVKKPLQTIDKYDILENSGLIIAQHHKKDTLPADLQSLALLRQYRYGDTLLSVYKSD